MRRRSGGVRIKAILPLEIFLQQQSVLQDTVNSEACNGKIKDIQAKKHRLMRTADVVLHQPIVLALDNLGLRLNSLLSLFIEYG